MLKVLELRAQLEEAQAAAEAHRSLRPDFAARRSAHAARKTATEKRVDETQDDASDEELAAMEAEVEAVKAEGAAIDAEEASANEAFEAEQGRLDAAAEDLERQIAELENTQQRSNDAAQTAAENHKGGTSMHQFRSAQLATRAAREQFFMTESSKAFLERVKAYGSNSRALEGVGKVIPPEWNEVLREELPGASKLLKYVRYSHLKGDGRQPIVLSTGEAIWIDAVGTLNETSMAFGDVEYDAYAVGSYIAIPNIYLASNSLIDLGEEVMSGLINAVGVAYDKAMIYGTNVKMPLGVVTRLAQTSDPSDQSINYPFVDLHSTHIITAASNKHGADFFLELGAARKVLKKSNYPAPHGIVWCMNSTTHATVDMEAIYANVLAVGTGAADASVMPVLKGAVEELEFIPDDNIVVGFFDFYGLADRDGGEFGASEHPFWIQNRTCFKGVQYADGMPLLPAAFAVIGINGTNPTTSLTFAPDYANKNMNSLTVTAAAHGSTSGKTVLTVAGKADNSNTLKYKVGLERLGIGTVTDNTWTDLTSGSTGITAAAGTWITVAELDSAGKVVGLGYVTSVPKA